MRREMALFYITEVILTLLYLETQNLGLSYIPPEKIMISSDGHIRIGDMDALRVIDLSNTRRRRRRPALYGCLAPLVVSLEVNPFQYPSDVFNAFAEYPEQVLYYMDLWNFVEGSIQPEMTFQTLQTYQYLATVHWEDAARQALPPPILPRDINIPSTELLFTVTSRDTLLLNTLCGPDVPVFAPKDVFITDRSQPEGSPRLLRAMAPVYSMLPDGRLEMATIRTDEDLLRHEPLYAHSIRMAFNIFDHMQRINRSSWEMS